MRKFILFFVIFISFNFINAQKILFDCSTGESASNADWVIDADTHNLNSNWPTTTGGSEANPQQIPTPAQSSITGSTAETFWNGALSAWGVECVKYNSSWTIETLPYNGLITYGDGSNSQDLSNYKVFVLDEPNSLFSAAEKTAIINFVNNGGGLFLISDHDVADRNGDGQDAVDAINDLLTSSGGFNNGLGMTLDYANFTDAPTTNLIAPGGSDPLIDGTYGPITAMEFHGATSMTINTSNNSTVKGVVYKTGATLGGSTGVMVAYCTYGSNNGRVVLITDSSPADDKTGDSGDTLYDGWNQQNGDNGNIHMNATIWLMGAGVTGPNLSVSPSSLSGFTYVSGGGPSTSQNFDLSGTDLDGSQVTVTASTNYEVSVDDATFGASVNVDYTATAPTLNSTTIYVRLKAGLAVGTYNSENVTCSDNGTATDKTVSNDGEVTSGAASSCESFDSLNEGSYGNYSVGEFIINNGLCNNTNANSGNAVRLRNNSSSYLELVGTDGNGVDGGIGDISFWYRAWDSSPTAVYDISVNINGGGYSTIGTINTSSTTYQEFTYSLNNSSDNIKIKIQNSSGERLHIDDFCYTANSALTPTLTATPNSFTGYTYVFGSGPSTSQNYILSGTNLDASDITIIAPTNYEVSGDDATFSGSLTITTAHANYDGTDLTNTTIYIRLKAGLSVGLYNSENVTNAGGGATTVNVSNDGEVTAIPSPTLTVSTANLTGYSYIFGSGPSNSQSFDLSGTDLDGSQVTITAPTNYEVSVDDATFGASVNVDYTATAPTLNSTTIYVRLKAGLPVGTYNSENVTCSDNGTATDKTVSNDGEVIDIPTVFISEIASKGNNGNYQDEYVEISNNGAADVDMTGWSLEYYNSSDVIEGGAVALSGTLAAGDAWVIAARTSGYITITPDFHGNFPMNSSCYVKLKDNTATLIDEAGTASSDEFSDGINYEFTDCTNDNKPVANWDNNGTSNGTPGTINCVSTCTPPSTQATNLTFTNIAATSMTLNWDTGDGTAGVVILAHEASIVDANPSSGTDYIADADFSNNTTEIGTGNFVVYKGDATTFDLSGLLSATDYYFEIYEYNTVDNCYLIPGLTGSQSTLCDEPTTDAGTMVFSGVSTSAITVSWTSGNGSNRIVVAKEGLPVDWAPVDLSSYLANSSFGTGTEMGTGNYIVYNGNGASVNVSNLNAGTTYYFKVFEYNCDSGTEDYFTSGTPLNDFETTIPNDISNFKVDCSTATIANLSWTLPLGSYDGIMIAVLPNAIPDNPTCAGNTLINPITDFSSADVYCSNASGAVYVYNNVGTSVSISGLTLGTSYHFKAFTYKNSAWSSGTEIIETAEVSDVTDLYASCGNGESMLSWTNTLSTCFDEVIIAVNTTSVTGIPSGTYTANSLDYTDSSNPTLSDGSVIVYNGTTTPQTITGLTNGITYYFKVFVRSGSDWSAGTEVNCTATTATFLDYGDLAIVGINTHYVDYDNNISDDEIQFVCFKDITTETSIDFTDNGYERLYADKWADSEGTITLTRIGADIPAGTIITVRGRGAASNWHVFIGSGTTNGSLTDDDANWIITDGGAGNNVFDLNGSDQIWMMQGGVWNNPSGSHNATYTGKVLYGWTATEWKLAPGYDDTKGSTIFPSSACSVTNLVGVLNEDKVRYDSTNTATTQRDWISRFNDEQKWNGYTDSTAYQGGGTLPDVITITGIGVSTVAKWTGETSSDWDDCTNWLNLKVPSVGTDVEFVSDDCLNDIVIQANQTVACNNLNISGTTLTHSIKIEGDATAILEVHGDLIIGGPAGVLDFDDGTPASDGTLKVYGDWYENTDGGFLEGNSSVEFIGSILQSINTSSTEAGFYNLKIDNSSTLGVSLANVTHVYGLLNLSNGILNLNGADLTISGEFMGTNGLFSGHQWSNIIVNGSGTISYNFNFATPQELSRFTMNRSGEIAVLGTNLIMDDLQIDGGTIELAAGKQFTVTSNLNNNVGTTGLVLKSDGTGTASLLHNTANVLATSERYLQANQWHFLSIPLDDVAKTQLSLTSTGLNNPNFYWYNEIIADYWKGTDLYAPTGWTSESGVKLSPVRGYVHRSNETRIYNLTGGELENLDVPVTLSYTDNDSGTEPTTGLDWDEFEGWNMFVNPYPCALDWDAVWTSLNATEQSYLENGIYYMDNSGGSEKGVYKFFGGATMNNTGITLSGGSQIIPANQAVFIKATPVGAGKTIIIPASARLLSGQTFWKKSSKEETNTIRLSISNNNYEDETIIRSLNNATFDHDYSIDAYKMFSWNDEAPSIYTSNIENSKNFGVNSIPEIIGHTVIPIKTYIATIGECSINNIGNSFENIHVWLEDRFLNNSFKFNSAGDVYTFNQTVQQTENRFYLHFDINHKPIVNANIPDQVTIVNELYSYTISDKIFKDVDFADTLKFSATLSDGSELPSWLVFDSKSNKFIGKPKNEQILDIKITATDIFGAKESDSFILTVKSTSYVSDISKESVSIYPNPTKGFFTVELPSNTKSKISIIDLAGRTIFSTISNSQKTDINLNKFSVGVYFIEINFEGNIVRKKVILE